MATDYKAAKTAPETPKFATWKTLLERQAQQAEESGNGLSQRITSFLDRECSLISPPPRPTKTISPSTTGWGGWGDPGWGE